MSGIGKRAERKRKAQTKLPDNQETRINRPPGGHESNVLTKFHEDWAKNVSSRLFTCFHYIHIEKTVPPPGDHVFPPIMTIFELAKNVTSRKSHVLTEFHEDWTKNVISKVFTCFHYIHIEKTAPPPVGHVFSPIWTIFELIRDINKNQVFTRNTTPPPGGHLHEDYVSNVTSTVFELSRGINGKNLLTKFHEDRTINVSSRVFTWQNVDAARRMTDDGQQTITKAHHEHVVPR
ncbi:hypothetical protein DPMN_107504 [Dreissena polymorpha]|uniref:Uncharacterized protein n=1 Tax=Dreissena polymorpha TaxID=45954 RepID=A0A9D4K6U3_DREPO|nr:hypothetical protein DPMN_107504 [Dreissena polymorpha]